jgi:hypothetical protein
MIYKIYIKKILKRFHKKENKIKEYISDQIIKKIKEIISIN